MAEIILNVKLNVLAEKQLKQLESTIKQIGDSLSNVKVNRNLTTQINALTKQYNALAKAAQTVSKANNKQQVQEQKLAKVTAQANTAKINEKKANVQLEKSELQLNIAKDKATKVTEQNTAATKKNTKSQLENRQSMLSMMQGFAQWQLVAMAVMKPLNLIRNAWASLNETLKKTEDAVIALQRVLPSGSGSDSDIANKLYDLAQKYGQTFENASEIATNFARTGMSWADTIKATEAALLALNVAELDATQASDGLIAVMSQFHYSASQLTEVIDMLNKTADNFPVTTEKLLTALQRTGSSADNANLSLQETIGLVTALSKATGRSGENIGTAVNSLIQYSSKSKSLDIFGSLDERTAEVVGKYRKGAATILDVWQEVSRVINSMDERQESILSGLINDDDIKNLEQELQDELGDIFETVSDVYGTANTFRKNYFIALLGNMQTVQDAIDTANDSLGYSQKENEKYINSYTAKVNSLKDAWQKLANDEQGLLGVKKALVDIATTILGIINGLGGIKGIITTTLAVLSPFLLKWTVVFGKKTIVGLITNIKSFWTAMRTGALSANAALGAIGAIFGVIALTINIVKSAIDDAKEAHKEWIDTTTQDSADALTALDNVKNKISDISAEYLQLAKASNEYTDTLDEQKKLQKEIYEQNLSQSKESASNQALETAKQYLEENYSKIYNAQKVLSETSNDSLGFGAFSGTWDKSPSLSPDELRSIMAKYGIDQSNISAYADMGNDIENLLSLFGYNDTQYFLGTRKLTLEEQKDIYQKLFDALRQEESANGRNDQLSYTISAIQDKINSLTNIINPNRELLNSIQPYQDFVDGIITYDEYLGKIGVKLEEVVDIEKTWEEQAKDKLYAYQDLLDIVNKMRDAEQDIADLEEKQLELEKAKQALEDARENKNVRVFNATTGQWELEADQKAIASAEENVRKAEKGYENAVWNNLSNEIKDGNLTVGEIFDKVKDISEDIPNLANIIREALIEKGYNVPAFDNGGVLQGLGGIKATVGDEIVLPPEITRQVLQPVSNEQFSSFVKSLGLLFGTSRQVMDMHSGMVSNVNNADNSVHNSNNNYVVNGVPISRETAEKYTIVELFENAADFRN